MSFLFDFNLSYQNKLFDHKLVVKKYKFHNIYY